MSRYTQPLDIYNRKLNPGDIEKPNEAMQRGHRFESTVLDWYEEQVGGRLFSSPMLIHPEHEFLSATPDALWVEKDPGKLPFSYQMDFTPIEAKTSQSKEEWGFEGSDDIPQEYIMQAQQQMAVTDTKSCDVPVLFSNFNFKLYTVERNDDLIQLIIESAGEMIERIRDRKPPEPNWQHPKTYELIRQVYGVSEGNVSLTEEASRLWLEAESLTKQAGELNKKAKENKAKILHEMGENGIGHLADGRHLIRKKVKREARQVRASEYVTLRCKKEL